MEFARGSSRGVQKVMQQRRQFSYSQDSSRGVEKGPSGALAFVQVTEQWLTDDSAPASPRLSELFGLD